MSVTNIEWTRDDDGSRGMVWNPVRGCSLVSAGCTNCYAMRTAHRFAGPGGPYEGLTRPGARGPVWTGEVRTVPGLLVEPLRWRKPRRVFVNSMSDLFHEGVSSDFITRCFAVMAVGHWHTYQVLTKRAWGMAAVLSDPDFPGAVADAIEVLRPELEGIRRDWGLVSPTAHSLKRGQEWPLPNVWLGVSVEDQAAAGERIPHLVQTPAAVRFLSCEPLLGPIDLTRLDHGRDETFNALTAEVTTHRGHTFRASAVDPVGWVIAGGESGPGARAVHPDWARSLVAQCRAAGVPVFMKQLGSNVEARNDEVADWFGESGHLHLTPTERFQGAFGRVRGFRDKKGGDWSEWPADLRVRQFPEVHGPARVL